MLENARRSLSGKFGCRCFDVCEDAEDPASNLLYEVYDDPEAFAAHKRTEHYRSFDARTAAMISDKRVRAFAMIPS